MSLWPDEWRQFVVQHNLIGKEFDIQESVDLSGVGGVLEILSEADSRAEAEELYPGIGVKAAGFVPVGGCSIGTGDPYFLNTNDIQPGPLYRIYHDEVIDENYDPATAIARVLNCFEELLTLRELD